MMVGFRIVVAIQLLCIPVSAFIQKPLLSTVSSQKLGLHQNSDNEACALDSDAKSRRAFLTVSGGLAGLCVNGLTANADDDDENFASIAARASKILKEVEAEEKAEEEVIKEKASKYFDSRTVYDFKVPMSGEDVSFGDIVRQEFYEEKNESGEVINKSAKCKAILVVNLKQDDPIARKDIPEFISMAAKYGRSGEFVVVMSPTDQGYFEADTSQLIRLKLASEYGYGINPATVVTDKMNLLGSGAHPFWRYLEGQCRTPSGLGRIEGNFEKFLVDGVTGRPIRRYPRKYMPFDIKDDIEAVIAGKPLAPAGANWKEEWRQSEKDSEKDTYRFQKGLNVFDQ